MIVIKVPRSTPTTKLADTAKAASLSVSGKPSRSMYSATGRNQSGNSGIYRVSGRASRRSSRRMSAESVQTMTRYAIASAANISKVRNVIAWML